MGRVANEIIDAYKDKIVWEVAENEAKSPTSKTDVFCTTESFQVFIRQLIEDDLSLIFTKKQLLCLKSYLDGDVSDKTTTFRKVVFPRLVEIYAWNMYAKNVNELLGDYKKQLRK